MAFKITGDCINCGVCEPVCPNHGIRKDERRSIYVIDADSCTECVGFFKHQQCAAVCPVNCCILDPRNVQSEAVLFERAQALQADSGKQLTLNPQTSRFRTAAAPKWWERLFGLVKNGAPTLDVTQRDPSVSETFSP